MPDWMNGTRQPTAKFLVATAMPNAFVAGSRAIRDQVIAPSLSKLSQSVPVLTDTRRAAKNRAGIITPDDASVQCRRADVVATAPCAASIHRRRSRSFRDGVHSPASVQKRSYRRNGRDGLFQPIVTGTKRNP